jgi:hypothetical protein
MGVREGLDNPLAVEVAVEQRNPGQHLQGIHADLAMIRPAKPALWAITNSAMSYSGANNPTPGQRALVKNVYRASVEPAPARKRGTRYLSNPSPAGDPCLAESSPGTATPQSCECR